MTESRLRVLHAHRAVQVPGLLLTRGDPLTLGAIDEEFPGWRRVRSASGVEGWAPRALLDEGAIAPRASQDYDARELDVDPGDDLHLLQEVEGWLRVRAVDGRSGWIPAACVREAASPQPVLRTPRLLLRPMQRHDGAALIAFYGCPEVMDIRKFGVMDAEQALGKLEVNLAHWRRHGFGLWAVTDPDGGDFMGECGLRWLDDGSDVELSYGLFPAHRGKGYATQASAAVIEHGVRVLGLPRIVAVSRRDNLVSHRVLYKCGMQRLTALDTPESRVARFVLHRHGTAAC